ncbi:dTDP-glucose 4,6-dehydratase [Caloramator mitchellensis]|uniref:dTDP-glucose 4,6-dehydratase n=1 Tax=Caloramator mitchellensis TaxID=908809 RepID=A0A0R3JR05_CALMK|nr:NAD(P)-dependent oxidoreductase [Caloramator mitchellensis]KRQ85865.1 dTDP-glucose 4,6-dehydratase [Caloramator mitchellensis]
MKKILITGANGMIGSSIVNELIDLHELILIDLYSDKIDKFRGRATIINFDLRNISEWESILEGVNTVIHLAAAVHWTPKNKKEEQYFIKTNVEGTRKLFEACNKYNVARFLFFSTNDVYEASNNLITEETPVNPKNIYGKSKLLAEQYLLDVSKNSNTSVCIFRPASVYGENDKGSMKSLIDLCKKGVVPMIGKGKNKKALLYIKDLVQAVKKYADSENDFNREIFNISSGNYEYIEIINSIAKVFDLKPIRIYIPKLLCTKIASKIGPLKKLAIAGETKMISCDKASILLGYKANFSLVEGLKDSKYYII